MRLFVRTMSMLVVVTALVLTTTLPGRVDAAGGDAEVMPPQSHAFGKSLGEWTVVWGQWILLKQNAQNPVFHPTGDLRAQGQSGKV